MGWSVKLVGVSVLSCVAAVCVAQSQTKTVVRTAADLPRFSYPLSQPASALLKADDATFLVLVRKVEADVDAVLAGYSVEDKATLRSLLEVRLNGQLLTGDAPGALASVARIQALQEKPEQKVAAALRTQPFAEALQDAGTGTGTAYQEAFRKRLSSEVSPMPWATAAETVKTLRRAYTILSANVLVAAAGEQLDPQVAKTGGLDLKGAGELLHLRVGITMVVPIEPVALAVLNPYIAAHTEAKPDIWAASDVVLSGAEPLTPVRIGIFDSGVDTALFPGLLFIDPKPGVHSPHGLAFDTQGQLYNGDLKTLSPELKAVYPTVIERAQGLDDIQNGIDSPAAAAAHKVVDAMPADQIASYFQQEIKLREYMHGTHVAGIAVQGNPAARLVVVQFDDGLEYLPFAPTVAWAERFKAAFLTVGQYFRDHDVRVVNMSWGDSQGEIEQWLNRTSTDKDPNARKQLAAQVYAIWRQAVEGAIQAAPHTLWVCAAGNSNSDARFLGDVPASLHLPNLVTVGAVDQAGNETSFTSYGDTVVLDADGYQVNSVVPGGARLRFSGTSMASPNVANLAAKLLALDPQLTPEQTIALMKQGAHASADGRLHLIDPKATVALLPRSQQAHR